MVAANANDLVARVPDLEADRAHTLATAVCSAEWPGRFAVTTGVPGQSGEALQGGGGAGRRGRAPAGSGADPGLHRFAVGGMAALRMQDFDMLRRRVNVSRSVTESGGLV